MLGRLQIGKERRARQALWILLIVDLLLAILLLTRVVKLTEGVYTLHLGCDLDYHVPIRTVVLACPGVDYIRLWPLPVE